MQIYGEKLKINPFLKVIHFLILSLLENILWPPHWLNGQLVWLLTMRLALLPWTFCLGLELGPSNLKRATGNCCIVK